MNIRQRNDPGRWTAILQGKCRKQGWKNSGFAVHLRGSFLCLSMLECFKVTNSWLCSSQQSNRWNRTDPINAWSCQSAGTPWAATIVLWLECVSVEFRPFPSTNPPNADCSPSMWTSYNRRRTFDRFLPKGRFTTNYVGRLSTVSGPKIWSTHSMDWPTQYHTEISLSWKLTEEFKDRRAKSLR